MSLPKFAVKRPVTTTMLILIAMVFGFISVKNINLDMMPNMDIPVAIVSTSFDGAGPEEVERLVTEPIEAVLGTVSGVKTITSTSSYGSSIVVVEFENGTDIDIGALDMREKIDLIKGTLPEGSTEPMVIKIDINALTSILIGVSSENGDLVELKRTVDDEVVSRLEQQEGVASVSVYGGKEKEVEVVLKEDKMRGYGVSEAQVIQTLASENSSAPTGSVKQGDKNLSIRVTGDFESLDDIRNLPIITPTGSTIYLRDIADVNEVYSDIGSVSYINGIPSVTLSIQKQSTANSVNVSKAVMEEITQLQEDFPNMSFEVFVDPAVYIQRSLNSVGNSAVLGGILAVIVLYVFLRNFRSTLVVAVSMPISIISTFILMYYTGITLNILSLGGLALGIGMLVDNSIVVMESIFRKMEEGVEKKKAAIDGAKEVAMAVTSSTLTTIAVFIPITFVGGLVAQIFNQLAMTIAFSLTSSLVVSLTFVPMACSILLSPEDIKGEHKKDNIFTRVVNTIGKGIEKMERGYKSALVWCLAHKKMTFLGFGGFVIFTMFSMGFVGMEFIPVTDESLVMVEVALPKGSNIEETEEIMFEVAEVIETYPEVKTISLTVGGSFGGSKDQGTIYAMLVGKQERDRSSEEMASVMEKDLQSIPGAEISATSSNSSTGAYAGGSVVVSIKGDDLDVLTGIANDLADIMEGIEGTRNITTSIDETSPQANITVDRQKASALGISGKSISQTINTAVSGTVATTYSIDGDEYDIRVMHDAENFDYINDVENILIPTATGASVPLKEIATIEIEESPVSIVREDQQKYVTVSTLLDGVAPNEITSEFKAAMEDYIMPENYTWEFTGSIEQMLESFASLGAALIIALLLVYMIMAAQFESFMHPFIIMFSIPLALTGGFLGLFLSGQNFSITAFLGLIMLAGVVINNAIVLIDYTNFLIRDEKMELNEALIKAATVRLRPILMSTLTTVLALIPLLLSNGDGAELMKGLAAVVIFGLSLSTLVTLLFIPSLFIVFTNKAEKRKNRRAVKRAKKLEKQAAN